MLRCINCGMSIPSNSNGFCSDKCNKEYQINISANVLNEGACFNLIAAAIEQTFIGQSSRNHENIEINREFFKGKLIQMWCDCSDNFNQERLINYYEKFISSSARNI